MAEFGDDSIANNISLIIKTAKEKETIEVAQNATVKDVS